MANSAGNKCRLGTSTTHHLRGGTALNLCAPWPLLRLRPRGFPSTPVARVCSMQVPPWLVWHRTHTLPCVPVPVPRLERCDETSRSFKANTSHHAPSTQYFLRGSIKATSTTESFSRTNAARVVSTWTFLGIRGLWGDTTQSALHSRRTAFMNGPKRLHDR